MAGQPVNFAPNAQYDWQNDIIQVLSTDAFVQHFGLMGVANGPNHEFPIIHVMAVGGALVKLDVNMPDQLEQHFYGMHGITCAEIFQAISQAYNAGFRHTIALGGGTRAAACHGIIRQAFEWALNNVGAVRIIRPGGFYQLPPLAGGGNPPRVRMERIHA